MVANVVGSFVIGFYATLSAPDGRLFVGARQRHFVMTGICGGFTTFSMFSLETLHFATAGHYRMDELNVGSSVVAWLAAVWRGHALATSINRLRATYSWRFPLRRFGSSSSSARMTSPTNARSKIGSAERRIYGW